MRVVKPQYVICYKVLAAEVLKPSKRLDHTCNKRILIMLERIVHFLIDSNTN